LESSIPVREKHTASAIPYDKSHFSSNETGCFSNEEKIYHGNSYKFAAVLFSPIEKERLEEVYPTSNSRSHFVTVGETKRI